ncbi:MAG: chemotaxis protein CheD [Clostridiales bacterium]|nr:chemotaxis protein CheD [Clostridiales bacterium]
MCNSIKVGMADLKTCTVPDSLTTLGLGSCVGIALYDRTKKISGLAHIMLPDSTQITRDKNPAKFADTGIDLLIEKMVALGAERKRIQAKIAGGAQMFSFQSSTNDLMRIGDRNVEAVKKKLKELGIPILAEDTGANYGRTIVFFSETGELLVKSVGKPQKTY